jgi:hypothetical protein
MIPNVELAKELVTPVDDGRQCVFLRTRDSARLQAMGAAPAYSTPIRELSTRW